MAKDITVNKEGNVLFNDALNTFYLRLYGVGHMVKDHSDSERGNPLPPHRLLFPINSKGSFIRTILDMITHDGFRYTSRGALARTRNTLQWVYLMLWSVLGTGVEDLAWPRTSLMDN